MRGDLPKHLMPNSNPEGLRTSPRIIVKGPSGTPRKATLVKLMIGMKKSFSDDIDISIYAVIARYL